MRLIKLNESQYKRLFEASPTLTGLADEHQDTTPGGIGSEKFITSLKTDKDGALEFGESPTTNEFAAEQSPSDRQTRRGAY